MEENSGELVNKYIEKLNEEIAEATKRRIVLEAKHAVLEELHEKQAKSFVDQWEARVAELKEQHGRELEEARRSYERRVEDTVDNYDEQIQAIKNERGALQDENNNLRIIMQKMRDDMTLTAQIDSNVLKKKKKPVT